MIPRNVEERLGEGKGGMDDNMNSDYRKGGVNFSPLEVMFRADLNGRRGGETEGDNGAVNRTVSELSFRPISLEGP